MADGFGPGRDHEPARGVLAIRPGSTGGTTRVRVAGHGFGPEPSGPRGDPIS